MQEPGLQSSRRSPVPRNYSTLAGAEQDKVRNTQAPFVFNSKQPILSNEVVKHTVERYN